MTHYNLQYGAYITSVSRIVEHKKLTRQKSNGSVDASSNAGSPFVSRKAPSTSVSGDIPAIFPREPAHENSSLLLEPREYNININGRRSPAQEERLCKLPGSHYGTIHTGPP